MNIATVQHESTARAGVALDLTVQCAHIAEDNKARDIVILDTGTWNQLGDFGPFVAQADALAGRTESSISVGLMLSVICAEERLTPISAPKSIHSLIAGLRASG